MDIDQFDKYVLVPALTITGLYSPSAHALVLGTGIMESNYQYLKQFGDGPGNGIFEVEEPTYNDIARYMARYENLKLKQVCLAACLYSAWPDKDTLIYNLRWATIVCRLKYHMIAEALPQAHDITGLANYYRKYYNTPLGAATMDKAIEAFKHASNFVPS